VNLPFDLPDHVRRHGAGLRQLALELLGDAAAADDAVQQAWLAAMQKPPRHHEAVAGWLARMVRNVAIDWRRGARRRARREQIVATAKTPLAEDPAETIARVEAARRLLTAVESLAEPYRGAIWQRFFDELPPRAIAAARGVPVATVKSWLLRGLELLRERLARTDGADWRRAFAAAFGLGQCGVKCGAVAAGVLGGAIVATWTKVVIVAVVVLTAVLCWPSRVAGKGGGTESSTHASPPLAAAGANAPLREPVPSATSAGDAATATIRGRCVDGQGAPLAGCVAQLSGQAASAERMEAWLRDHEPPQWCDPPPVTTGVDGVFALRFAPPAPFAFALQVHSEQHGAIEARWPQLAANAIADLGDVAMGVGAHIAGRVVDGTGLAVANALVVVNRVDRRRSAAARHGQFDPASGSARTDAHGEFVLPAPLLPGDYAIESKSATQREPLVVRLEAGRDQRDLVVVVDRPELTTIRGRVVDETGLPVAEASVRGEPRPRGRSWTTDRDGAFELRIPCAEAADTVDVVAESPLHEGRAIAKAVAWGRSDIVLTLRNAARLELRVGDAEGRPVEQFTVRLLSRDYPGSDDARVRARGPFASGVAVVPGVRKGRWIAVLEFPSSARLATAVVPFAVDPTPLAPLQVTAHRTGELTALVVDETGLPVAGARIVVCHAVDAALDENTWLVTLETFGRGMGPPKAIIVSEATTDVAGRASLSGPIGGRLAVALPGGAHVPAFMKDVRLDDAVPLTIAVVRGARLRARVRTADELDALRQLCGITDGTIDAKRRPTLMLRAADGRTVPSMNAVMPREAGGRGAMSDDGSFELGGLVRERFAMTLLYWPPRGGFEELPLGDVDLTTASEREVALDLSALVPGTLGGSLTVNGKPAPLRSLRFEGPGKIETETDGSGRFEATLRAGVYRVFAAMSASSHAFVPVAEGVTVRAKNVTALPLDVQTGRLRLRLVRGKTPKSARIALYATFATSAEPVRLPRLEPDDALEVELPVGTIRIAAALDRLLPPSAARDAVELDTLTIAAGETTTVELRLPPGLGR
jgi:RNA polymerase sigma-70 factor (ECF subfamily)